MSALTAWFDDSVLATIDWWDWVDILVLAAVIYRLLVLMRGTRALQSLVALVGVGGLYIASDWLGLSALHWVLDHALVYVVLALLILFQEDIRRALARAGSGLFGRGTQFRPSDAQAMEAVIRALFLLAHRRIGALIVFERAASLAPYVEGAHGLDATISTELLQAIFHPASPLHDGAVLLSRNRIVAASAFLPISLSKDIARTWGTRHRAAIGLSEETDGICLVASEERGTVAMVISGEIIPVADANDLRQRLAEALGLEVAPPTAEDAHAVAPGGVGAP